MRKIEKAARKYLANVCKCVAFPNPSLPHISSHSSGKAHGAHQAGTLLFSVEAHLSLIAQLAGHPSFA